MDRRTFLCELALGTLATPVSSEAQQPRKTPRIGILVDGYPQPPDERHRSPLIQGLRDFGWVPQETVLLEVLHSRGQHERLPELAAALVRRQVDVIWVNGPPAAVATARATKTIPIVFWGVSFPVELGLVASLARPGSNVTGFAWTTGPELLTKQLEFLKTIAPGTIRVASVFSAIGLYDVNGRPMAPLPAMELAARQLAMELRRFPVQDPEELNRVLASILDWRAHALYVHGDPLTGSQHRQIIDFANNNRLPGLFGLKHFALAGGLLTYAPDTDETVRRSAYYLDKILKGAKPADLPIEQPTKFELVINMKTAKALGLTIPPSLLLRADQVIK